ncbi:MAG: fibronectin type III domain-containing protein, partial [Ignavibacteriota bacterium]
ALKESHIETAHNSGQPEHITGPNPATQEIAQAEKPASDPMAMPEVQYRGAAPKHSSSTAQLKQDAIDAARLKQMAAVRSLIPPSNLHIESAIPGSILVHWDAVPDALSYIIEVRGANDANFEPVTQVSQTNLRVTLLKSGVTYFVRVRAASGERKGLPSDAKSIVVP